MIFDFYLSWEFNCPAAAPPKPINFMKEEMYHPILCEQTSETLSNGSVTCLHRGPYVDSYAKNDGVRIWIFGYAYTRRCYSESEGRSPYRLTAEKVLKMRKNDPNLYFNSMKGSFALVIVEDGIKKVTVITDRLNVLPLYYARAANRLVLSSNTAMMLKENWIDREPDQMALTMQNLFDYMLGEYYFVNGIRRCENAMIYEFTDERLKKRSYWDVSDLYHEKLLPSRLSLDILSEQLKENVNLYASSSDRILVSLTGGFDGRTNLAMLDKPTREILCYSYGMPGSRQVKIPQIISKQTGIAYQPIFLDREFLEAYRHDTTVASYFSNGTAPVGFNNIPYAFSRLRSFSDTVITGLFGSEILRPLYNTGIQINDQSFRIFLGRDYENGITQAIESVLPIRYFTAFTPKKMREELIEYFRQHFFDPYRNFGKLTTFFFFVLQEGIRKYFSQELSIERVYVTMYYPYFDMDLIDLIYRTPWAGMYNGFLGSSKFKRRRGQLLYAHILQKYMPVLSTIPLDRGYTPQDLIRVFPLNYIKIYRGVRTAKHYLSKHGGNDTFKTEAWSKSCLRSIAESTSPAVGGQLFNGNLSTLLQSGEYLNQFLTYRHMASISEFWKCARL